MSQPQPIQLNMQMNTCKHSIRLQSPIIAQARTRNNYYDDQQVYIEMDNYIVVKNYSR